MKEPKEYPVKTIEDLAKIVTKENIVNIMTDLQISMWHYLNLKDKITDLEFNTFIWVDDGTNGIINTKIITEINHKTNDKKRI